MFPHINVWVDMLRSPVCVLLPIVTQPTGNWIMGGNLDGKTRLTNYWQRLQQKHILIWSPCCIPPSGIFYVGHFISKWTLGAILFWRLLWDLIAEKKQSQNWPSPVIIRVLSVQQLLIIEVLQKILFFCRFWSRRQTRVAFLMLVGGKDIRQKVDAHIFIVYHLAAAFGDVEPSEAGKTC